MEKLYIWFNPLTGAFYQRWCRGWIHEVWEYNSYGHLLIEKYEFRDNTLKTSLSTFERYKHYYNHYLRSNKQNY